MVRIDGFSSPDQYDDEAMSLWTHENYEDDELDLETSKYILDIIGDKFCQLVTSEKTALSWVKKDGKEIKHTFYKFYFKKFSFEVCLICGRNPSSYLVLIFNCNNGIFLCTNATMLELINISFEVEVSGLNFYDIMILFCH